MAAGKVALVSIAALLGALVTAAPGQDRRATGGEPAPTSALVLRASAPVKLRAGRGDASVRGRLAGRTWQLALTWWSERGHVSLGAVIAEQPGT